MLIKKGKEHLDMRAITLTVPKDNKELFSSWEKRKRSTSLNSFSTNEDIPNDASILVRPLKNREDVSLNVRTAVQIFLFKFFQQAAGCP